MKQITTQQIDSVLKLIYDLNAPVKAYEAVQQLLIAYLKLRKKKMIKQYNVYAITKEGEGFVEKIGEYEYVEDIQIRVGMFADDVLITIEPEYEKE